MAAMKREGITIAGGGIAGLSLGIGLRRAGVPVTLLEASHFPRHRVCGEFISGVSRETLGLLGVADLLDDAEICRETVWHDGHGPIFRRSLPEPALGISRYRLDQRMAERFQALGGDLREGERFRSPETPGAGVVCATGRPRDASSPWIGLKAHLLDFPLEGDLEMHLGEGGYIGLSRIEEGRVNACGLFRLRSGLKVAGSGALAAYLHACGLAALARRIGGATLDADSLTGVSAFQFGRHRRRSDGSVRIGDQHSIIGPFTGNGMSMAFQSAARVLPVLVGYSRGGMAWDEVARQSDLEMRSAFRRRLWISRLIHPLLMSPRGRMALAGLAKRNWIPFSLLFRAMR
jgi:menaquinone-9 beta-reductase